MLKNAYCPLTITGIEGKIRKMIAVTRLDGKKYWINPHMIESMEQTPDLTITMLSGKKIVIRDEPQDVIEKIIAYRRQIGIYKNDL